MKENPLIKVYWIRDTCESRALLIINKKQKKTSLLGNQLAENLFLFLASVKEQNRNKSEFISKFLGVISNVKIIKTSSFI